MAITFPSVLSHQAAEVFPDTEDVNLYYLVPSVPRLRMDADKPVFRGLFWTDTMDGTGTSVAGLAGGQLNFDVNLTVLPEVQEEIRGQIEASGVQQQRQGILLQEERERLDRLARATGSPAGEARVRPIGPIRFGSIQYVDGNVVLLEKQGDDFVTWSSAGGPPSLMGTNNSAFALRLGPTGAAVWHRGLEQDATAIGIRYELEFEVTLPSIEIHVWAGSFEKLEIDRKADRVITSMDQGCEDADIERIDVKEVTEKLAQEGLINVEIKKGSAKVSQDVVAQLTDTALSLISERVKQVIMSRVRGMTEEERRTGLQTKVVEELRAFAELNLRQTDVVRWKVNPQATLTDFLGGVTGEARKRLVTVVDLSDPVVATLEVPVTVNAPWDGDPDVTSVEVRLTYPAARFEDDKVKEVTFRKDSVGETVRWRRQRGDRGTVQYEASAYLAGQAEPVPVATGETNGPVHVEVPALGRLAVRFRPYAEDFALGGSGKVEAVQVDYRYGAEGDPDRVSESVVLRAAEAAEGRLVEPRIPGRVQGPVRALPRFLLAEGGSVTGQEVNAWVRFGEPAQVDLPSAWPDKLRVAARVRPGIPALTRVRVEVEHTETPGDFESRAAVVLEEDVEWEGTATLAQADSSQKRFRYRYAVYGADQLDWSPWLDGEGDGELPVLPVLPVRLRLEHLGLGTRFADAVVRLAYRDASRGWELRRELFLTDPAAVAVWLVPRAGELEDRYRYSISLTPLDGGEPVRADDLEGRGENLVLRVPEA